jgi:competence protein ComEC
VYGLPFIAWGLVVCFSLALIWRRKSTTFSAPFLLPLIIFFLLFLLGSLRVEVDALLSPVSVFRDQVDTNVSFEGVVVREPDVRKQLQNLTVEVGDELLLVRADKYTTVTYGDKVSVEGTLELPEAFETDLGRTFNYPGYLEARGIHHVVSFADVSVVEGGYGNLVIASLLRFKHVFIERIETIIPHPYSGLGEGLLLGVKQGLGEKLEDAFRTTGIMHIVVLSGYNMMLIITFTSFFLAFLFPQRIEIIVGSVLIVAFACLVGLGASVLRASAMALLLLLARATGRTYDVVRALVLVGVCMLLFDPLLLVYDVGFQLSFIATLGLILVSPHVERYATFMPQVFGLREFLITTVAAQIFVTPLLLYQIGSFSIVAVLVNVLVLPMVPVAMLFTFLAGVLSFVHGALALAAGYFAFGALGYIVFIAETFARIPLAEVTVPAFPFFVVVVVYAALSFVLYQYMHYVVPSSRHNDKDSLKTNDVTKWTIVDEVEIVAKMAESKTDSAIPAPARTSASSTPIFFR